VATTPYQYGRFVGRVGALAVRLTGVVLNVGVSGRGIGGRPVHEVAGFVGAAALEFRVVIN
jgi:hypothetical protein